jgi:hypothetical protein
LATSDAEGTHAPPSRAMRWLRKGWPVFVVLALLWFPFDWLATVSTAFNVPYQIFFSTRREHFAGHTVFYFVFGTLALMYLPALRRRPALYALGSLAAALVQETIQASFRSEIPTYTDFNAFAGDALGSALAFALLLGIRYMRRRHASPPLGATEP